MAEKEWEWKICLKRLAIDYFYEEQSYEKSFIDFLSAKKALLVFDSYCPAPIPGAAEKFVDDCFKLSNDVYNEVKAKFNF